MEGFDGRNLRYGLGFEMLLQFLRIVILADNVFTKHPVGHMQRILCINILNTTMVYR